MSTIVIEEVIPDWGRLYDVTMFDPDRPDTSKFITTFPARNPQEARCIARRHYPNYEIESVSVSQFH